MRQLSVMDAAFVYTETPRTPTHVLAVFLYDPSTAPSGQVTIDDVMDHLAHQVPETRTLRERLVRVPGDLDLPYWIDDPDFDLEFHVRHIALPAPGNWTQLTTLIARLHARALDLSRPPWEMYVIDGVGPSPELPNGGFAVIIKIHHAAIDGVAGVELLNVMHSHTPDVPVYDPAPPVPGEVPPTEWQLLGRAAVNNLSSPDRMMRAMRRVPAVRSLRDGIRQLREGGLSQSPVTRFNGPVSAHRSVDFRSVPLAEVKAMRAGVPGSTVNDVALSIIGGGLRTYLASKGELPERPLTAMVPISVRVGAASAGGNQISAMSVPIASDVADPVERLAAVHLASSAAKAQREGVDVQAQTALSEALPGALLGVGLRAATRLVARSQRMVNVSITNVPGSPTPLYLCGAKAIRCYGGGPVVDGTGLINLLGSYCDDFIISFTACREMMPDPAFYMDCLLESYEALRDATGAAVAASPRRAKGSRATGGRRTAAARSR